MNPNLHPVLSQWLRGGRFGGARALQNAALSMRMDDPIHAERDAAPMALCREIAMQRRGQPQADGG